MTRTVPVSGRFTAEQRAIYQIVRDAQAAAERVAAPGASYAGVARFGARGRGARRGPARAHRRRGRDLRPALGRPVPPGGRCAAPSRSSTWPTASATASDSRCTIRRIPWKDTGTFAPGDVFTIEPGVYVSTRLLDILPDTPKNRAMIAKVRAGRRSATTTSASGSRTTTRSPATGVEWLSRAPREIGEIEAAMARRGR